jgi:phage protein Gp37/Gp68
MRQLFVATSTPIALNRTRGDFCKGVRLMAIDGVRFGMPDTPANADVFGRPGTTTNGRSIDGAYPQLRAIFLAETGTHIVVEAHITAWLNRRGSDRVPEHIHLMVSVENQKWSDRRTPRLVELPCTRGLSVEPLFGPVPRLPVSDIRWVMAGGESGPRARTYGATVDSRCPRPVSRCWRQHVR